MRERRRGSRRSRRVPSPIAHRRADEVAESVDRADGGVVERAARRTRSPGARGDARPSACAARRAIRPAPSHRRRRAREIGPTCDICGAVAKQSVLGRCRSGEQRLCATSALSDRATRQRHRCPRASTPAIARHALNGIARKSSEMLDAAKALFLDGSDKLAVAQQRPRPRRRDTR